jgi:Rap1a immunity proteins
MLYRWQRIAALLLACTAFQLLLASGALAGPYTAEEMASECRGLLASAKKTADPEAVELEDTFSAGACWGAFLSIQQFVILKAEGAKSPMFQACVPGDVTLVQLIKLFASYTKAHPERDGEPFAVVALTAIRGAFQCSGGRISSSH